MTTTKPVSENCPAFRGGCPYAGMSSSAAKNHPSTSSPSFSSPSSSSSSHPVPSLASAPPATSPSSRPHLPSPPASVPSSAAAEAAAKCPAFREGCPFKGATSVEAMQDVMKSMPASHTHPGPQHDSLLSLMKGVHDKSLEVKASVGGDCPVFAASCPFKTAVCSDGSPLLGAMEYRSWTAVSLRPHLAHDGKPDAADHTEATSSGVEVARRLKEGTRVAHRRAETVHFVREFIKGRVAAEVYKHMVAALYFVYSALEEALVSCRSHPVVSLIHFPELTRGPALAKDLEHFWGPTWREQVRRSPLATAYVERIHAVAEQAPELLAAHAYTRYLGDLSGGQVLKRAAVKAMQLPPSGEGVRFYCFEAIDDMKVFKERYRNRLDGLPVDSPTADRLVIEANFAFELNTHLFHELDVVAGFAAPGTVPSLITPPVPVAGSTLPAHGHAAVSSSSTAEDADEGKSANDNSSSSAAAAAGCPFAALAKAGFAPPPGHHQHHSQHRSPSQQQKSTPSEGRVAKEAEPVSACPFAAFSALDAAFVLVLVAVVIYFFPFLVSSAQAGK